jgi:hypothetical protein
MHEVDGSHWFSPEIGLQVPHLGGDPVESAATRETVAMTVAMMEKCILIDDRILSRDFE